jgi:hypothetical protein
LEAAEVKKKLRKLKFLILYLLNFLEFQLAQLIYKKKTAGYWLLATG